MKKNWKKLLTGTLVGAMLLSGAAIPVFADEADEPADAPASSVDLDGKYNAYLMFQTPSYSFRNAFDDASYGRDVEGVDYSKVLGWDDVDTTKLIEQPGEFTDVAIEGNGTYTVSVSGLAWDDKEFASQEYYNIIGLSTDIPNSGEVTIDLDSVELNIGGRSVDITPMLEETANYVQVSIQNIWKDEIKEIGYYDPAADSMSITFTVSGFNYDNEAGGSSDEEGDDAGVDLDGKYNAYLMFQTPSYSFRNAFNDNYGRDAEDSDYYKVLGWDDVDTSKLIEQPGEFTDAVIEGNGTYTVSVSGLAWDDKEFATQEYYNIIGLSTDIPNTGDVTVDLDSVELNIGGRSVDITPLLEEEADYVQVTIQNIWKEEIKEIGFYDPMADSMSITFTVSGFNYDNEAQAPEESSEAPAESTEESTEASSAEESTEASSAAEESKSDYYKGDAAATTAASTTGNDEGGLNPVVIVVIVVVVIIVIAAIILVAKKKKN